MTAKNVGRVRIATKEANVKGGDEKKKTQKVTLSVLLGIKAPYYRPEITGDIEDNATEFYNFSNGQLKKVAGALKDALLPDSEVALKGAAIAEKFELPGRKIKRDGEEVIEFMAEYIFLDTPVLREYVEDLYNEFYTERGTGKKKSGNKLSLDSLDSLDLDLLEAAFKETQEKLVGLKERGAKLGETKKMQAEERRKEKAAAEKAAAEKAAAEKAAPRTATRIKTPRR
jgi:hypothetical protein